MKILKSPFQVKSSQAYVEHYFDFRKSNDSSFGYRTFADECGLKSVSYLQMVVKGKRILSLDCVHRIAEIARLSFQEHMYLETLALLDAAKEKKDQDYYRKKLRGLKKSSEENSVQLRKIPTQRSQDRSEQWRLMPMIALLASSPETLSKNELLKRLGGSTEELREQLDTLIKLELAEVEDNKIRINLQSVALHDPKDIAGAQKNILRELLSFSQKAFEKNYKQSKFYSHSFTADPKRISEINEEVRGFFANLTKIGADQNSDQVVQINLQCFDLFNVVS